MKILVADDDTRTAAFVEKGLKEQGHTVDCVLEGRDALHHCLYNNYDLVVLDRMMPGLDGLAVLKALRAANSQVPVIFLTAMADVDDRVDGLMAGADDYLVKPFAFSELSARLDAMLRRASGSDSPQTALTVQDLHLDLLSREVRRAETSIDLQPREFRLLEFLMRHAGQVVTRTMLLEHVWDYHFDPQTNVIDVHISRLRAKIDKGFDSPLLTTVRGAGYKLA